MPLTDQLPTIRAAADPITRDLYLSLVAEKTGVSRDALERTQDYPVSKFARRMKEAKVTDPAAQPDKGRVWFGATVTLADDEDGKRVITLVGEDEADAAAGRVSWSSPLARAVRGATIGDVRRVALPSGEREYEVIEIRYPD